MIIIHESTAAQNSDKPITCPKCKRGRLGNTAIESEPILSRRGKPPKNELYEYVQVKCPVCGALWTLTFNRQLTG